MDEKAIKDKILKIISIILVLVYISGAPDVLIQARANEAEPDYQAGLTLLLDADADIDYIADLIWQIEPSLQILTLPEINLIHISSEELFDVTAIVSDKTIDMAVENFGHMAVLEQEAVELQDVYSDGQPIMMQTLNEQQDETSEEQELYRRMAWHAAEITSDELSLETATGKGIKVGLIDSGVDYTHPVLSDNISMSAAKSYVTGEAAVGDTNGHGTMVAGIIIQVAPGVVITPYRVIGESTGDSLWTIEAIIQAVNDGQDILNMSLGTYKSSDEASEKLTIEAFERAVEYALSRNVVLIASAGNKGINLDTAFEEEFSRHLPGSIKGVLAVSATNSERGFASYSNYGSNVGLSAPGGDLIFVEGMIDLSEWIYSTYPTTLDNGIAALGIPQGYTFSYGTSLSAPGVSGGVACIMEYHTLMTGEQADLQSIREYLRNGTIDLGPEGYDIYFGDGLINVYESLMSIDDVLPPAGEVRDSSFELHTVAEAGDLVINISDNKDLPEDVKISYKQGYNAHVLGIQEVEVCLEDLSGNQNILKGIVVIVDTTAPTARAQKVVAKQGDKIKAQDFVTEVEDNAGNEYVIVTFGTEIDTSEPGVYAVEIVLADLSGNQTIVESQLEVIPDETKERDESQLTDNNAGTSKKNKSNVKSGHPATGDMMRPGLIADILILHVMAIMLILVLMKTKNVVDNE